MNHQYFFSVRAAERITNQPVQKVSLWRNGAILVHFKNGKLNMLDPDSFKRDFVDFRQQQSRQIAAQKITPTRYSCASTTHPHQHYAINIEGDRLQCSCKDWIVQEEEGLRRPCCKHCYAVLREIGCDSLQDFLKMPF